jgi:hypothetical protein
MTKLSKLHNVCNHCISCWKERTSINNEEEILLRKLWFWAQESNYKITINPFVNPGNICRVLYIPRDDHDQFESLIRRYFAQEAAATQSAAAATQSAAAATQSAAAATQSAAAATQLAAAATQLAAAAATQTAAAATQLAAAAAATQTAAATQLAAAAAATQLAAVATQLEAAAATQTGEATTQTEEATTQLEAAAATQTVEATTQSAAANEVVSPRGSDQAKGFKEFEHDFFEHVFEPPKKVKQTNSSITITIINVDQSSTNALKRKAENRANYVAITEPDDDLFMQEIERGDTNKYKKNSKINVAQGKAQAPVPENIFENDFEINRDEMHKQILAGYEEKIKDLQFLRAKAKAEVRKEMNSHSGDFRYTSIAGKSREEALKIVHEMQMNIIKKCLDSKPR